MPILTCCVYHNGVPCQFRVEREGLTWQALINAVLVGLARHADAAEVGSGAVVVGTRRSVEAFTKYTPCMRHT